MPAAPALPGQARRSLLLMLLDRGFRTHTLRPRHRNAASSALGLLSPLASLWPWVVCPSASPTPRRAGFDRAVGETQESGSVMIHNAQATRLSSPAVLGLRALGCSSATVTVAFMQLDCP